MSRDVVYRRKGLSWTIKANTVTFIDENKVSAQELKKLYGDRIDVITRDRLETDEKEILVKKEIKKPEVKKVQISKPVVTPKVQNYNNLIDDLLTEIKNEIPIKKEDKPIVKVEVVDSVKEGFMTGTDTVVEPKKSEIIYREKIKSTYLVLSIPPQLDLNRIVYV